MAATPKTGTMFFKGQKTNRTYGVNVYVSDVNGAAVLWNPNGTAGTGSQNTWRAPTTENVTLYDFAMTTGTADTTTLSMTADGGVLPGTVLPYATYLTTINTRPYIGLTFNAGTLIGAVQNA